MKYFVGSTKCTLYEGLQNVDDVSILLVLISKATWRLTSVLIHTLPGHFQGYEMKFSGNKLWRLGFNVDFCISF